MSTTIHLNAASAACPIGDALDDILRNLAHADQPCPTGWALDFVGKLLPAWHPALSELSLLQSHITRLGADQASVRAVEPHPIKRAAQQRQLAEAAERRVTHAVTRIRASIGDSPVEVEWIEHGVALRALADRHGVSADWHEPDELTTRVTSGTFDNAMGLSHLEQCVIFLRDTDGDRTWSPVAAMSLATLCAAGASLTA